MPNEQTKNLTEVHGKRGLHLIINDKHHEWHREYITGAEIRTLGNICADAEILLALKKPWDDEPVPDDKEVNLARPEIEHFYSKDKHFKVVLIVNLKEKHWTEKVITFEQVITLAYGSYSNGGSKGYTVTYDRGPHQKGKIKRKYTNPHELRINFWKEFGLSY